MPKKKVSKKKAGPSTGPAVVDTLLQGVPSAVKNMAPEAMRAATKELVPLGTETGKTLSRAGMLVLRPMNGLIWGIEKFYDFVEEKIAPKVNKIPEENLQEPDPQITGPSLEALRYCGHKQELADMFASLIANSMDQRSSIDSHPSFVDVIRQMTSDEAIFFKGLPNSDGLPIADLIRITDKTTGYYLSVTTSLIPEYLYRDTKFQPYNTLVPSLERFGLLRIYHSVERKDVGAYDGILEKVKTEIEIGNQNGELELKKAVFRITPLGLQLRRIIISH
jgi:ribosomal protein L30/L7E